LKAGFIGVPEYLSGKISRDIGIKHEDADAMSKKLILGIALSLVIISGGYFRAQANCCGGCLSRNDNLKITRLGRPKFTHPCLDFWPLR